MDKPVETRPPAPRRTLTCICGVSFGDGDEKMLRFHEECPRQRFIHNKCPDCGNSEPTHYCPKRNPNPEPEQAAPPRPLNPHITKLFGADECVHCAKQLTKADIDQECLVRSTQIDDWNRIDATTGLPAPAAIEQARPQTPQPYYCPADCHAGMHPGQLCVKQSAVEDLRPIAGEILRQMDNAGWIREHVKRDWEDMKTWLAERLAPGLVAVRVYPPAAAEPAPEPSRLLDAIENLRKFQGNLASHFQEVRDGSSWWVRDLIFLADKVLAEASALGAKEE